MVRVKKPEGKEMFVGNHSMKITIISVSACGVLVVLLITSFIIIIIKMRTRKANGYDLKDIDSESELKVKERQFGDLEEDSKETSLEVFHHDVHNKSVSSEESTKFSDSVYDTDNDNTDNISESV